MEETLKWLSLEKIRIFSINREGENRELEKYLDEQMDLIEKVFGEESNLEKIKMKVRKYRMVGRNRLEGFRKRLFSLNDEIECFENDTSSTVISENSLRKYLERAEVFSYLNEHQKSISDARTVLETLSSIGEGVSILGEDLISDLRKVAYFRICFSNNGKRRFKIGHEYSKKSLSIDPNYVPALVQYGRSKYRLQGGDLVESLGIADKCISLNPDHHLSHWLRSSILEQLHRPDEAMKEVKEMIRIDPNHPWSLLQRASIYDELKIHEKSVLYYTYSILLDSRDPLFYYNRGYSLKRVRKNHGFAYRDFTMALTLDHGDIEAWNNRGIISSEEMGSLTDAERDFSCAIHFEPNHANSYYNRGVIRDGLSKSEESFDDFTKALELRSDPDVYYYRAYVCYHNLPHETMIHFAVSDLLKFSKDKPKDNEGKKFLKKVCLRALEVYISQLDKNPYDISVLLNKADALIGLGMILEARKIVWKVEAHKDLKERFGYLINEQRKKLTKFTLLNGQQFHWFKILLRKKLCNI